MAWIRVENGQAAGEPTPLPLEIDGRTDLENQIEEGHVPLQWLLDRGWFPVQEERPPLQAGHQYAVDTATVNADHVLVRYRLERDPPPAEISIFQAEQALDDRGLLDTVMAMFQQAPEKDRRAWERVTTVRRESPLIARMAAALGLTDEQVDDLFRYAATLQPE